MIPQPKQQSVPETGELDAWKRQESTFCVLHLVVLAVLLLVHTLFTAHFGVPSRTLVIVLAGAFLLRVLQLVWIQGLTSKPSVQRILSLTATSVLLNLALAFVAALLTDRSDSQYFVLLVMPVVETAFRFTLTVTIIVIAMAGILNFLWIAHYAQKHGPVLATEYFEAGTISLIYAFVGVLVWTLVNNLRANEAELSRNLQILQQTQEKLLREEKLAVAGRLSSAIAHEIRNPVAMIASSLATAFRGRLGPAQREHMFEIASIQATRLEQLTNDFLAYARPRPPAITQNNAADVLAYVAELSAAHAGERKINIEVQSSADLSCDFDATLLQQALLNLVMNAIEASPDSSAVVISGRNSRDEVHIDVKNTGVEIDPDALDQIFEPFFTTKPKGTGLGLAIARNAARTHGGDLTLTQNGPEAVVFTLTLPVRDKASTKAAG